MLSYNEPKFIGKAVFQILAKMQNKKNGYLVAIWKRYNILFFSAEFWFFLVHKYMVQISLQNNNYTHNWSRRMWQ